MPLSIYAELAIILVLILANGFFAAAEIAVLTSRRSRLEQRARSEGSAARAALELARDPNRFLITVQVGMTLLATLASVFSGATLVRWLADRLTEVPYRLVAQHHQTLALVLVVLGLTYFSMVFGELVPKQLALASAERWAGVVALPVRSFQAVARPAVWLLELSTSLVLALFGGRRKRDLSVSVEDIEHLILSGMRQGVLDPAEQRVARKALRLGDHTVRDIMRPRIEIDALDADTPPEEVIGAVAMAGFSRLPVHEGDLDHVLGFVYTKDLLLRQHMGWPIELRKLVRPALLVPQTLRIDKLLEHFRQNHTQMAIVLDEFGGTEGLVTMEDVLEELVGEIHDEHRPDHQEIVQHGPGRWEVDAGVGLHDLLERIGLEARESALPPEVSTTGGLLLWLLGRIPKVGDHAAWESLRLEVVQMDGRRLDRLAVTVDRPAASPGEKGD
ncbi:MAG: hemolysin family protein [Thermoguttaceae bacterium]|jgi:putative hemolysin